jgi:hypothetical protein
MERDSQKQDWSLILFSLCSILSLALMPSNQSFWHDEVMTMIYVRAENFGDWLHLFLNQKNSEGLMPVSMFWFWLVGRFGFVSVWALRATNGVWGAVLLLYSWRIAGKAKLPFLPWLVLVNPFVWYYVGELRPYALQLACGAGVMCCLLSRTTPNQKLTAWDHIEFTSVSILLCGSSLLGAVSWVAMISGTLLYMICTSRGRILLFWKEGALLFILLSPLAFFYLKALQEGAGAARLWNPGIGNIAFSFYKFGGWLGLGPGRNEIRETVQLEGFRQLTDSFRPYAFSILLLGLIYTGIAVSGGKALLKSFNKSSTFWINFGALMIGVVTLAVAAGVAHWPFWGRHLSPLFISWVCVVAVLLHSIRSLQIKRVLFGSLILLLFFSSLSLRFAPRHARDDLRAASELALDEADKGRLVWWAASSKGAEYYGIEFNRVSNMKGEIQAMEHFESSLDEFQKPDVIIMGRPSLHDASGEIRIFASAMEMKPAHPFTFMTMWSRTE